MNPRVQTFWIDRPASPDQHVAFRGAFSLSEEETVELHSWSGGWHCLWMDGVLLGRGPVRYDRGNPAYEVRRIRLAAGPHLLAVQAHHLGVETRLLEEMPPFVGCDLVDSGGSKVSIAWTCEPLEGYQGQVRRINPQLGWIDWCDLARLPVGWREKEFDDSAWSMPVAAPTGMPAPAPADLAPVQEVVHSLKPIAAGQLAEVFGYEKDDIPARFFLRDLEGGGLPPQGIWRRYDLGRVRLGSLRLVLDLPEGAVVQIAYSEELTRGRVAPWINLSAGPSCNLDHFIARDGEQEIFSVTPKGGRFVEVHVLAPEDRVEFGRAEFIERAYYGRAEGSFTCGDALLERIWQVGVETFRACCEDALVDNPTRERGQWTGDAAGTGMEIASVAFSDNRLCRRSLLQAAQCARADGLVAGLCPGGRAYLSTYSLLWVEACWRFFETTGDLRLLEELADAAERNLAAFEPSVDFGGLRDELAGGEVWIFIDWGYVRHPGPVNLAYNIFYLQALRAAAKWMDRVGRGGETHRERAAQMEELLRARLSLCGESGSGWAEAGFHAVALALRAGLILPEEAPGAMRLIKEHMLASFPNRSDAPRNAAPACGETPLITPFFLHFVLPVLLEAGEEEFVLNQIRHCWGWALGPGWERTTWLEVFDPRWSHCHQWSGCPTWILSRFFLGLHPRYDLGEGHFDFHLCRGDLTRASGILPLPGGETVRVSWQREGDHLQWSLVAARPLTLHHLPGREPPVRLAAGERFAISTKS